MRKWENQVNRLIRESALRRASDGRTGPITSLTPTGAVSSMGPPNSTNPRSRTLNGSSTSSQLSHYSTPSQGYPGSYNRESQYRREEPSQFPQGLGPSGYPSHGGFDFDPDEDDYEDYPSTYSGRGTPQGDRRVNARSMPAEHRRPPETRNNNSYLVERPPRANTEDTTGPLMEKWRVANNMPPPHGMPPPPGAGPPLNPLAQRPAVSSRLHSNMSVASGASAASYTSEASFGNGIPETRRPALKSKFSTTRLNSTYGDEDQYRRGSPAPSMNNTSTNPTLSRSRSASQPQAYIPKSVAPPLPTGPYPRPTTSMASTNPNKRGSGSSQSTGDSSDYSPGGSSPITPFDSSDSSLGTRKPGGHSPTVKVKVHFHEDIFVIQVPRGTEYDDLVEKVGKKIRLCGPRRDDGPLRVKYRDEDGDMVSLGSTEDVQMAFEQFRPGGQVTLFVN